MLYMDGMKLVVFIFNFFQGSCEVLASFDSFCLLLLFCSAGCGMRDLFARDIPIPGRVVLLR